MSYRRRHESPGLEVEGSTAGATGGRDLDETDPTPPEYDLFKQWFWGKFPEETAQGSVKDFQKMYRAFQAGYWSGAK